MSVAHRSRFSPNREVSRMSPELLELFNSGRRIAVQCPFAKAVEMFTAPSAVGNVLERKFSHL